MNVETKHNHNEAFCLMQYSGRGQAGTISLQIWNSRDGVTPFMMFSTEYGIEMAHVNWQQDRYLPNYKPVKGDLIWRDYTQEEAENVGRSSFQKSESLLEQLSKLNHVDLKRKGYEKKYVDYLRHVVERGEVTSIASAVERLIGMKEPKLELVTANWPVCDSECTNLGIGFLGRFA